MRASTRNVTDSHEALSLVSIESPVERLLVGTTRSAIRLIEFTTPETYAERAAAARERFPIELHAAECPLLEQLRDELAEYFAGKRRTFDLPLAFPGTPFQEKVWAGLLAIAYGQTVSYLDLARSIGSDDGAVRAVGQANGMNPIAIVIPCHRVINANGTLGGYGGGPWRKQYLLDLERGDRLL